jgi:hypothetical protein
MVPTTGLEPVRCYSLEPESSASANSATWATCDQPFSDTLSLTMEQVNSPDQQASDTAYKARDAALQHPHPRRADGTERGDVHCIPCAAKLRNDSVHGWKNSETARMFTGVISSSPKHGGRTLRFGQAHRECSARGRTELRPMAGALPYQMRFHVCHVTPYQFSFRATQASS